ncbi:hypothetical protein HG531_004154 [Fusarium graminearum]|nr:hypothetical protein HG531_004154 [Fusarium graminearum]
MYQAIVEEEAICLVGCVPALRGIVVVRPHARHVCALDLHGAHVLAYHALSAPLPRVDGELLQLPHARVVHGAASPLLHAASALPLPSSFSLLPPVASLPLPVAPVPQLRVFVSHPPLDVGALVRLCACAQLRALPVPFLIRRQTPTNGPEIRLF